jgi:hypothetical protein
VIANAQDGSGCEFNFIDTIIWYNDRLIPVDYSTVIPNISSDNNANFATPRKSTHDTSRLKWLELMEIFLQLMAVMGA